MNYGWINTFFLNKFNEMRQIFFFCYQRKVQSPNLIWFRFLCVWLFKCPLIRLSWISRKKLKFNLKRLKYLATCIGIKSLITDYSPTTPPPRLLNLKKYVSKVESNTRRKSHYFITVCNRVPSCGRCRDVPRKALFEYYCDVNVAWIKISVIEQK